MNEVVKPQAGTPVQEPYRLKNLIANDLTRDVEDLWAEIGKYDLTWNIAELEVRGVTVIPPEKMARPGFHVEIRNAVLAAYKRRFGLDLDFEKHDAQLASNDKVHQTLSYMLLEDKAFQDAAMDPIALIMAKYLLGKNVKLSSCQALIKQSGGVDMELHTDSLFIPPPHPVQEMVCNITWALTEYDEGSGPFCYVPGSHKYKRDPILGEGLDARIPIYAKAGSMIIWGGELWHAALARQNPGLRLSLVTYYARGHIALQEIYRDAVSAETLAQHPPEFAKLIGRDLFYPWTETRGAMTQVFGRNAYD